MGPGEVGTKCAGVRRTGALPTRVTRHGERLHTGCRNRSPVTALATPKSSQLSSDSRVPAEKMYRLPEMLVGLARPAVLVARCAFTLLHEIAAHMLQARSIASADGGELAMCQRSSARAPVAMSTTMMWPVLYVWSNSKTQQRCCVHRRTAFVETQLHGDGRSSDRVSQVLLPPQVQSTLTQRPAPIAAALACHVCNALYID